MYYVGIDLGGTNIACGIVDVNGKLLLKKSCKTGADRPVDEIMTDMARLVDDVIEHTLAEFGTLAAGDAAADGLVADADDFRLDAFFFKHLDHLVDGKGGVTVHTG